MVRRSVLSVPGSSERMLHKAVNSAADEVVIDLEDAVAVSAKDEARATVVRFLRDVAPTDRRIAVRVNAPGTPWAHEDLIALASLPALPHSVVIPKVESAGDLAFVDRVLTGVEAPSRRPALAVQALIESAAGLLRLDEICAASPRLDSLILGYADLAASLQRNAPDRWLVAQERLIWSARAAGLAAVDGPHLGVSVDDEFRAALRTAVSAGFDAKWVIHPSQIDAVNTAYTPSAEDVAWARGVVAALDGAHGAAVQADGRMIDEAVAVRARQVIARLR
jgi:citrate lyase subunit beta/citryl-CoA lyase